MKWQVAFNEQTIVPFERCMYQVGISSVEITFTGPTAPRIIHIIARPHTTNHKLWIGNRLIGACLRSIVNVGDKKFISRDIPKTDIEWSTMNFAESWGLTLACVNDQGIEIGGAAAGTAVLTLVEDR